MNVDYLRKSAARLQQPSGEAADAFERECAAIAEKLSQSVLARPDIEELIGEGNTEMMKDNSRNMMRFMLAMFRGYEPEVLVQTVLWVFRAYRGHGFKPLYWAANLNTAVEHLHAQLGDDAFQEIEPFFSWLVTHLPVFTRLTDREVTV